MRFICGNDAACLGAGWDGPEGQTFSYGCCGQKFLVCLLEKDFVSDFSSLILEFVQVIDKLLKSFEKNCWVVALDINCEGCCP